MDPSLSQTLTEAEAIAILEQLAGANGPAAGELAGLAAAAVTTGRGSGAASADRALGAEMRYRSLVERLPVVTFMAELGETVQETYISPQIEQLLGFTQQEWLDNPILWFRQIHPDDRVAWVTEFARTCATGSTFRSEYRMFTRDGRVVWIQGECQLMRDGAGCPRLLQGVAFDITHLKRAAAVEEEKLAAVAASRAKSEFLARMSHEIRTPLNGVLGMLDLLGETGLTDAQQRYAHLARESADALMKVINDILDFSKIEAGKVEIECVEFDLHRAIEELTETMVPLAERRHLTLACFLAPGLPRQVRGDPVRVRQVLTNLVGNAMKFTKQGRISVRAALDRTDADGPTVRIRVQDTGIGIPPDRLGRLFKSFSQVDTSTTRKFGGTGLGLAISKNLVELMGGQIGIDSTEGVGTTFWFTLKLAAAEATVVAAVPTVAVIAVVADETARAVLAEQLDGHVARACVVGTDEEAARAISESSFDVALLPFTGSADGPLHREFQQRGVRRVALVDGDDATTAAAAVTAAGFAARLRHPVMPSQLLAALAQAGSGDVAAPPAPAPATATAAAAEARQRLGGLHLLVAEDNEMNQFVTQETLRRGGITCDIVADGAAAVAAVQRQRYDAVLMDCQMPGMDGMEATRRIRQHEAEWARPRLPIIALTADAIQGDREKCLSAGMDTYTTKPVNAAALFAAIAALTGRAAAAAAVAA